MRRWLAPLLLAATPLSAQEVDLELVLLADASGSISQTEIDFQRQGYAEAIVHPEVLEAISTTLTGSIAVTYVEWAANQAVVVDWTIIDGEGPAREFADMLLDQPRVAYGRNAIGAAMLEGKRLIEENGIDALRRVIDFSGDSASSFTGPPIEPSRAEVLAANITINGLPILCEQCHSSTSGDLVQLYYDRIIGGPGAFVVPAESREQFAQAVRRKLVLEIAGEMPSTQTAGLQPDGAIHP